MTQDYSKALDWYLTHLSQLEYPIYSSYDVRKMGQKVVTVDANIYPAGFNNILPSDLPNASQAFDHYLKRHFANSNRILLVTEEHTLNKFYWDNVITLKNCLEQTGRSVLIAFPRAEFEAQEIESFSKGKVWVYPGSPENQIVRDFNPDLIVSNNDFSQSLIEWSNLWNLPVTPPRELGWYQRQKSTYFSIYNNLAVELADLLEIDPFWIQLQTEIFESFEVETDQSQKQLANHVERILANLKKKYEQFGVTHRPVVFIKNNAGTYGLAVTQVHSGQDVLDWGYKHRKKMKAAKGGRKVNQLILQEGVPTEVAVDGAVAESVVYMVGCQTAGHFLRYHPERAIDESLNAPGAKYLGTPVKELQNTPSEWVARLGLLSIGYEARQMGVTFKDFEKRHCLTNNPPSV